MAKDDKKDGAADKAEKGKATAAELTPEEAAAKAKKKKKLILFGAIGLVVLAGGGGGAMMFMGGKSKDKAMAAKTAEGEAKPEDAEAKDGDKAAENKDGDKAAEKKDGKESSLSIDFGQTFSFAPFHLNLGNPIDNRYVRLEVAVEYMGGPEQQEEFKRRLPQLRDAVVSVTSRKTREFLLGPDGKDQLRLEIKNRLNQYMSKKVENVFITDILIE